MVDADRALFFRASVRVDVKGEVLRYCRPIFLERVSSVMPITTVGGCIASCGICTAACYIKCQYIVRGPGRPAGVSRCGSCHATCRGRGKFETRSVELLCVNYFFCGRASLVHWCAALAALVLVLGAEGVASVLCGVVVALSFCRHRSIIAHRSASLPCSRTAVPKYL